MPEKRARARSWSARLALAGAVAVLLGQLGRWSDRFDAINLVLPFVLAMTIAAALVALIADRRARGSAWRRGWVALLGAAGALPLLIGGRSPHRDRPCAGPALRLVQFNMWKGNRDPVSVERWILRAAPDLVLLDEAQGALAAMPGLSARYPYRQSCTAKEWCSTIVLARSRPVAAGGLAQGDSENRGALSAAWMRVAMPGGPVTIVAVHLGRPWPFPHFAGERAQLVDFVRMLPSSTTLVAGDVNLPGWTFQLRRLEGELGLARRTGYRATWPAMVGDYPMPVPLLGIDQIFAGDGWAVDDVRRGPYLGSDHLPLLIALRRCADGGGQSSAEGR